MKTYREKYLSKRYLFSISILFLSICGFSQNTIAAWDFANWNPAKAVITTAPASFSHQSLTVSNLTMGAGINTATNYFSDDIFGGTGTDNSAKTLAEAIANNEYFEFTLTATSPKLLTVNTIAACVITQGRLRTFSLFSSKNGFTAGNQIATLDNVVDVVYDVAPLTFPVPGHTELSGPVTFRIYSYGVADINYVPNAIGSRKTSAYAYDLQVNGAVAQVDVNPPSVPGSLNVTSVTGVSMRLNWTASTDDNEVVGYDVYNGTTLLGSTAPNRLYYLVMGLVKNTSYTFKVIARDLSGKQSGPATLVTATTDGSGGLLPIGMNVGGSTYYSSCLPFTDAMKMSGDFMTFYDGGPWDSEKLSEIPMDADGYPTVLPFTTSDGKQSMVRKMLNSFYSGRYVLTFDGVGVVLIEGIAFTKVNNNKYYIDFNGIYTNVWLNILTSNNGNHLKNFKLLPLTYENSATYPTFNAQFLDGLRPFSALRFMDWINTNGSEITEWNQRVTKTYHTQAGFNGASYDYAIELANELDVDAWVTVPYKASDDFIQQTARLWRDGLHTNRKIYTEYANEIWNWQFMVAGWVLNNAPGHSNAYVSAGLAALGAVGQNHPEKDAYMMARNFKLWSPEFTGANAARLVRVAAVQHGWTDNTRRILVHLFDVDGVGCDVVSPGGYFNFGEASHNSWLARCGTANPVTPDETVAAASTYYDTNEAVWSDETAGYANARGIGYVVYEGGQHMQPWMQGDWCYNQAVWDAQIKPSMYQMYMKNFLKLTEPQINCQLFMAFAYMGGRESKYGSWGHLESMSQIGNPGGYMTIAPKYQALLDANIPKTDLPDVTKPVVTAFSFPASSTSLAVAISSFTATDNKAVTGFKLTETSVAPLAGDAGWTTVAPASYTFATEGTKTLYAWAKDKAGNVSASASAQVIITLSSSTATLGNTEVFSLASSSTVRRAMPVTFNEAGQIQSISVYHNAGSGNVMLGVYSDAGGKPSALLGVTPSTAVRTTAGWQTVTLTAPVTVTSGQKVWLAWVFQNVSNIRYERTITPASVGTVFTWSVGMPSAFGTSSNANYNFSVYCTYTTGAVPDAIKPIVTAFSIPANSASLVVPVSSFTATDNKAVTGFKLTETSAAPLAGDADWTTVAPASYTFAAEGTKTLYAWAKDEAGNVSISASAQVVITLSSATATLGNIEVFSLASSSTVRRAIPVTFNEAGQIQSISVYHNAGSGNVLLGVYSDAGGKPSALLGVTPSTTVRTTAGWQTVSLTTPVNVSSGQKVWLAWVFQNVSNIRYERTSIPASVGTVFTWSVGMPSAFGMSSNGNFKFSVYCTYTTGAVPDVTKPIVTAFTIPANSASLVVPVSSFTATDNKAVTGFKLTETSAVPLAGDAGWTTVAPASYTFAAKGTKTLYAWAKDAAGNVSVSTNAQVVILTEIGNKDIFSLASSSTLRRAIPVTFTEAGQIQSISVYHNAGSGNVILGVYSDVNGFPSSLLGVTPSTAVRTTAGWQKVTLTTPVPVISAQKVWLAWVFQNVSNIRYERSSAPASVVSGGAWSSGIPSAFGTSYNGNFKFSVYCTYIADNTKSAIIAGEIEPVFEKADLKVYPSPFSEKLRFEFVSPESVNARIDLYDMTGRIVKTIFEQPIEGGVNYEAEFRPETIISGMYIYRMTMGETVYNGKVVFKKE